MILLRLPRACESVLSEIKKETKSVVVDFHAEATSEKCAMAGFSMQGFSCTGNTLMFRQQMKGYCHVELPL